MIINILKYILYTILPNRCVSCEITIDNDGNICQKCWSTIHFISGVVCFKCGYPIEFDFGYKKEKVLCAKCPSAKYYFNSMRSICSYGDTVANFVSKMKYNDNLHIIKYIAKAISIHFLTNNINDIIIAPVPMYKKDLYKRKFNQSALITAKVVKLLHLSGVKALYVPDLIYKIKQTKRQNQLNKIARIENVKNCFSFNTKYEYLINKNIFIIDDVITTGATVNECAKTIKKHNKNAIINVVSYARTTLHS